MDEFMMEEKTCLSRDELQPRSSVRNVVIEQTERRADIKRI
jgi:hypothetical protein